MRTVYNISCEVGCSRNSSLASPANGNSNGTRSGAYVSSQWGGYPEKVSTSHIPNWIISKLTSSSTATMLMVILL
jgi:hypothetical protein